jgi:hypothetical protein
MINYDKVKIINNKIIKLSYRFQDLKTVILWRLPKLRKHFAHSYWGRNRDRGVVYVSIMRVLKEGLETWIGFSKVRYVSCESCDAVGIDHNSEKYGWVYEGGHMWSCPKCKKEK